MKRPKKTRLEYTYTTRHFGGIVSIEKTTGKKRVALSAPQFYAHEINKFNEGEFVSISVTNKRPKRTDSQNRYWWGVYLPEIISSGMGAGTLQETHEDFCRRHLTIKEWTNATGQLCYLRKSSSELSTGEFNEFIIKVAADTGVEPPPTENYDLAPLVSDEPKKKK